MRVIGFALIMDNYWVCYEASFTSQRIMIYPSQSIMWGSIENEFRNLSRNLPIMCKMGRVWEGHRFNEPLRDQWDIVPYHKPALAEEDADGPIISIKVMQCLVYGVAPSDIITSNCEKFRKNLCGALFSKSSEFAKRGG